MLSKLSGIKPVNEQQYNVEYFHIYTDEMISDRQLAGLEYLKAIEKTWSFEYKRIILIDNYNPVKHTLSEDVVFKFLQSHDMVPHYWAFEGNLINNANTFLSFIKNKKLVHSYVKYIDKTNKYPCSLLTATWYLTRLGYLDPTNVIITVNDGDKYESADYLLNLLPQDYRGVEKRARGLILNSKFMNAADKIQDLFYPVEKNKESSLF